MQRRLQLRQRVLSQHSFRARHDPTRPRESEAGQSESRCETSTAEGCAEKPTDRVAAHRDAKCKSQPRKEGQHPRGRARCRKVGIKLPTYLLGTSILLDYPIQAVGEARAMSRGDTPARRRGCQDRLIRRTGILPKRRDDVTADPQCGSGARGGARDPVREPASHRLIRRLTRSQVGHDFGDGVSQDGPLPSPMSSRQNVIAQPTKEVGRRSREIAATNPGSSAQPRGTAREDCCCEDRHVGTVAPRERMRSVST